MNEIELGQIDTRYEGLRLKDKSTEAALLLSILDQGIREPLLCLVRQASPYILLDGFKRLRCAIKTSLATVPVSSLGDTESTAILQLLRISNSKKLDLLEQAALVDELQKTQGLSISEIARQLDRSPAWVSVRLGLVGSMSEKIKQAVFGGHIPVRAYMYTLRPFTRVKGKRSEADIESFVRAVSGKALSARTIDFLWHSYLTGGQGLRNQILNGNLDWTLVQLKKTNGTDTAGLTELELKTIKNLEWAKNYIHKIPYELKGLELSDTAFFERANLLVSGILGGLDLFKKALEDFLCSHKTEERP